MRSTRSFVDFGSTFTKLVAFDLEGEELLARVQVPSTVGRDVTIGLDQAFSLLAETVPIGEEERRQTVACSSAAGGLRVVCVGLVPEYTTEAGRRAALGAGAKIVGSYSFELAEAELREIQDIAPDIVLLTGGTDGGNKKVIAHNAAMLARSGPGVTNIIVAGNKSAYDEVAALLDGSGKNAIYTSNVMPEIGVLEVEAANHKIRDLFIARITEAKGIGRARSMIADVIMPTPAAVLEAAKLLADGAGGQPGIGELLLVDVGGATTDVYSVATGAPTSGTVRFVGLPEPYAKRTVEGDLGLFHNLDTLKAIAESGGVPEGFEEAVAAMCAKNSVPSDEEQTACHLLLSKVAVRSAVDRHVGSLKNIVTPNGEVTVQRGKDLSQLRWVVGAGGPVSFSTDPVEVLRGAVFENDLPMLLKPKEPEFLLDRQYVLFALGLLAQSEPAKALRLMQKYVVHL
ncbi:MAG: glutamate mutase L [Thermoleophilia bacterium]|nr:glutamate mutase L [Thermoleophilia bacterium]